MVFYSQANKTFVEMRKDMLETKSALESTVKLHKESVQKARGIEIEIEVGETLSLSSSNCPSFLLFGGGAYRQSFECET